MGYACLFLVHFIDDSLQFVKFGTQVQSFEGSTIIVLGLIIKVMAIVPQFIAYYIGLSVFTWNTTLYFELIDCWFNLGRTIKILDECFQLIMFCKHSYHVKEHCRMGNIFKQSLQLEEIPSILQHVVQCFLKWVPWNQGYLLIISTVPQNSLMEIKNINAKFAAKKL